MLQDALNIFKKFRYFFDIRGVETVGLDQSPDGWRDTIVEFDRSKTYNGVVRSLTLPYKFVNKAAIICRREYAKYTQMARIIQRIQLGDGRNNYTEIYRGKLDMATKQDTQTGFTVSSKTADFSANIDAYADQKYSLSLEDGMYVEITPISLNETATLIIGNAGDGGIHSNYYPPITVVNNKVNSINPSVFNTLYQQVNPDVAPAETGCQFYKATLDTNLYIKGSMTVGLINTGGAGGAADVRLALYILNGAGVIRYTFYDDHLIAPTITSKTFDIDTVLSVQQGEQLYLYTRIFTDPIPTNVGITFTSSQLDLSYQTTTPATMCKALSLDRIFGKLLQAMNVNTNSQANQPVPYQSFLLKGLLKDIYVTSSDSIRASQGSIYHAGDTLFQGIYLVLSGTANYNGIAYTTGQQFTYTPSAATFTGDAVVEKVTAIYGGVTYNPGETLQAGGTYLVEGSAATYNGIVYDIGQTFKYVLGQDSFTSADSHGFVKQIAAEPQLITSFSDLYQTVKSLMGGNASFGVDADGTDKGRPFIEDMSYVFRKGVNTVKLGNVDKDWKSTPAVDLLYNSIKVGYEDQQYDAINGTQEVNSTQYYGSPLLSPTNELDLISRYRADPIGIETVRITQQDTAASRSDNDAFIIWINPTPLSSPDFTYYHPLRSRGWSTLYGVDPSYYNYFITPKQNLLRGGPYLSSIFYNMAGYQLKLTGWKKNISLVTIDLNGRRVAEADPIEIGDLPFPYFIPEYYDINQGLAEDVLRMLSVTPYGDLSFVVNGKTAKGFISNVKIDLGKQTIQDIKLLLTGDNNLEDFVR